jgi:nitroreductase
METTTQPFASAQDTRAFEDLIRRRRATPHFRDDPVPERVIVSALTLAGQAPSGYNFQPWRFLVLRDGDRRASLRKAAYDQAKITEAPVVIVAYGQREGWKDYMDEIISTRKQSTGGGTAEPEKLKMTATTFVARLSPIVWLNRQVMIGFTYLMLAFEALGWDTAPMEGFDGAKVRAALGLPDDAEVVALLAVGRAVDPRTPNPGRLDVSKFGFNEVVGRPFNT